MIDTVQAVLLFVIVILTILFIVLGIQVFLILKDLRVTIKRTNKILDDVENLTSGVNTQLNSLGSMFTNASVVGVAGKVISTLLKFRKER